MAWPGAPAACPNSRSRAKRPMDKVLHQGAACVAFARSRAHHCTLGGTGKTAIYIRKARFPSGGLIRSGMLAAIITAMTSGQPANAQDLKRGEALLARNCASCHAVAEPETARKSSLRRSAALANAIQLSLWRKRLERALCPVIRICRNFHSMRRTSVQLLLI